MIDIMIKYLAMLTALPTWIMVTVSDYLLPYDHIYKGKKYGLYEWTCGRTKLCCVLDGILFVCVVNILFGVWIIG